MAAVQRSIAATSIAPSLPPAPSTSIVPPPPHVSTANDSGVPPVINTNASTAGTSFGQAGTQIPSNSVSQISQVSINGRAYQGAVYDSNHNRIA